MGGSVALCLLNSHILFFMYLGLIGLMFAANIVVSINALVSSASVDETMRLVGHYLSMEP